MRPSPSLLECHRVSVLGRVIVVWLLAVVLIFVGMMGTGVHLFAPPSVDPDTRFLAGVLGWPSAVVGPCMGIMGILWVLTGEERRLEVHREQLLWCDRLSSTGIPWQELAEVTVDGRWPRRVLRLRTTDGRTLLLPGAWLGHSAAALASRLLEVRRRALLGVPDRLPPAP